MPSEQFEQFRHLVLENETLQTKLRAIEDRDEFVRLVVGLGKDHGYAFADEDVHQAMGDAIRAWIER